MTSVSTLQNSFVFSGDDVKDIEINFGMHKNIIEGLEAADCKLQHVYFNAGGKWYGEPPLHTHSAYTSLAYRTFVTSYLYL